MDATAFQSTGKPKTLWCVLGEVNNDNTCHNNDGGGVGDGGGEDDNDDDTEYEIIKLVSKV